MGKKSENANSVSSFLDNKQLVHIASEVVILLGVVFYFSSKNKKLLSHIEELSQRVEEQEDSIQKLNETVQKMNNNMGKLAESVLQLSNNQTSVNSIISKLSEQPITQPPIGLSSQRGKTQRESLKESLKQAINTPVNKTEPNSVENKPTEVVHKPVQIVKETPVTKVSFGEPQIVIKPRSSNTPKQPVKIEEVKEADSESEDEYDDSDLDEDLKSELEELESEK
jgi:uncharacterized coiled-coil protein SlyX